MLSSEQAGSISPVKKEKRRRHAPPGGGLAEAPQTRFFDNFPTLAALEKDPGKCPLYFSQRLLEDPDNSPEPEPPVP
jgi:hypothetical protein